MNLVSLLLLLMLRSFWVAKSQDVSLVQKKDITISQSKVMNSMTNYICSIELGSMPVFINQNNIETILNSTMNCPNNETCWVNIDQTVTTPWIINHSYLCDNTSIQTNQIQCLAVQKSLNTNNYCLINHSDCNQSKYVACQIPQS